LKDSILEEHEKYKELLAVRSLGVLDPEEEGQLKAHLSSCAECRRELDEWSDTAALLAYAAGPSEPRPELRARILESIRSQPRPSPLQRAEQNREGSALGESPKVMPFPQPIGRAWGVGKALMAIAASVAFVALLVSLVELRNRSTAQEAEIGRLYRLLQESREETSKSHEETALLFAPETRVVALKGTQKAPEARARLTYDPRTGEAILYATDLPAAPSGKAYQLWFIADGKPLPGRVFTTDAKGSVEVRDQVPAAGRNASLFAVTLEPASGVKAPTGDKFLLSPAS
jgi:anti-sigma-K factor RskA